MTIVIAFLSLALATASLLVLHERRQRRGLESLLQRVLYQESLFDPSDACDACGPCGSCHSSSCDDPPVRHHACGYWISVYKR